MKKFSSLFLLLFFLGGCTVFRTSSLQNKELLLRTELEKWNSFRMDGVIEVNYREFVFRKQFTAQKNKEHLRFDVIDSGFWGFSPTPFYSLYADSLLYIKSFPDYQLETMPLPFLNSSLDLEQLWSYRKELIAKGAIEKEGLRLEIWNDTKLKKISFDGYTVLFSYNYLNKLETILINKAEKKIATIIIDKQTFFDGEIDRLKK